jgi:uncharacterized membrane protein
MQEKYSFLPFAAKVLRVVGWVILVLGVISSIVYGILTGGITGIFSFLAWVFLLASKELLYLFMDVEENTRNTAERIAKKSD